MKKLLIAAVMLASVPAFASDPNEKVLEAFQHMFNHAKDVKWTEVEKNFEARFHQDEILVKVQYDIDGNIIKSTRYYNGNVLPIFIQGRIQKKFQGKTIYRVTEVTMAEEITYHIILEDANSWTHVQSDSFGYLIADKKFKKG
jgi:hypothetical protein